MKTRIKISLDAMGGDAAPEIVIYGAHIARKRYPYISFVFFGDEGRIMPLLQKLKKLREVSEVVHTDEVIEADAKPSVALRNGRNSSMRLAIEAVKNGQADAVVSAGNTGALMAISKYILKTVEGVSRPAIASFFPTLRGESVMLDLGANVQCDAQNLYEFSVMGGAFARSVLGIESPTIGLLNIGSEEIKGHEELQKASTLLREHPIHGNFHGFVEGDDIAKGTVDVVVTDGFTGNIALKTAEGTARLYTEFLRGTFRHSILASIGYVLAKPALRKLRKRVDPRRYNGAVFLGLNGIAVKSHGGTDALGFAHAIGVAADLARHRFVKTISSDFSALYLKPSQTDKKAMAS